MRLSLQPEPRPEHRLRVVTIDEIVSLCSNEEEHRPPLEYYFSPSKKEAFIKDFLNYLNTGLLEAIMQWQREQNITSLAKAFGRSVVIPSFFSFLDKKTLKFYRATTQGITYRVAVPEELE